LGYTIYANYPPGSHILDVSSSLDYDNVFSALYSSPVSNDIPDFTATDMQLFSIEAVNASLSEYQFNYVQPFAERMDVTPCADSP
jgi:hypothetical protein